ncbi:MAG TPA: DUF3343 domain-containing protein [Spirochaetota bacterium]|nr:DUF3343 domain-containing protein [Spirochaetota bacterium]
MRDETPYMVVLFRAVSHAMKAERVLKERGIPVKLIPVPKHISSDCGVCIRFTPERRDDVAAALAGAVDVQEIRSLR